MEDEIEARKKYEEEFKASGKDESLREKGKGNSSGKEEGGDLHEFNRLRTGLHFRKIHEEMAGDVMAGLKEDTDVVIMIAGGPHIPGLAAQLKSRFEACEKLVVGNFPDNDKDATFADIGRESCSKIGKLSGFEINEDTKQAYIPEFIEESIDRKSQSKIQRKGDVSLVIADDQIEDLRENKDTVVKNFADRFPSKKREDIKKISEAEDLGEARKSWQEIVYEERSKDDSSMQKGH